MDGKNFGWIGDKAPTGNWDWVQNLFGEKLDNYYKCFIQKTLEIPFDYSERSIVGQVAIVANTTPDYYTLQDYDATLAGNNKREDRNRYRPDMWFYIEKKDEPYLFEFK
jgi:hypothetical protein